MIEDSNLPVRFADAWRARPRTPATVVLPDVARGATRASRRRNMNAITMRRIIQEYRPTEHARREIARQ